MADQNRGLFFDFDHTLIRPASGALFPKNKDDWEFLPGIVECIKPFVEAGYLFVVISNQGGIEKGFETAESVETKLNTVLQTLGRELGMPPPHGRYEWLYCASFAEHPDRKPNAGLITRACLKLNIDPIQSLMVGDMDSDRAASAAGGVREYYDVNFFLAQKPRPRS